MSGIAKVYFFADEGKLPIALEQVGVGDFKGARVPIKLHMGEAGNSYFVSPSLVKQAIDKLKSTGARPFLFDTTVAYPGARATVDGHRKVASRHGFGKDRMGCEVVIGDKGIEVAESGQTFDVAREIHESTHLVVISHVKGHIQTGFGGAIKNLGMGGVTRETKRKIHLMCVPILSREMCDLCGTCAEACPFDAISVESEWRRSKTKCMGCGKCVSACGIGALRYNVMDLQKALALSARACVWGKRALYVNSVVNISRNCDCDAHAGPIICPDIGYLASDSLAAIDRASLDLINTVKPGVFEKVNGIDPAKQIRYAEEIGFPSDYELIKL
jgi:uncharacterized Fe-S center protein